MSLVCHWVSLYESLAHQSTINPTSEAFSCVWAVSSWSHSRRMDLGSTLPPPQLQPSRRGVSASFRFKKTTQRLVEIWVPICTIPTCHQDSNGNAAWQFEVERVWENRHFGDGHGWIYISGIMAKCQTYWIDSNYSIWLWCACKHSDTVHMQDNGHGTRDGMCHLWHIIHNS